MVRLLVRPAAAPLLWVVAHATMRGVDPSALAKYSGGAMFKCFDGKSEVPARAVNDDFCDCVDGSDEPGTGACAGQDDTLFHCQNAGATPQLLYASRVDDGVCDCCDGSDESGLAARYPGKVCANRCAEEGAKDLQDRKDKLEKLKVGLAKKEQIIANAKVDRTAWTAELKKLKDELPALEAALEEAKKIEAEKAPASDTAVQEELVALRKQVAELQKENAQLKADCKAGGAPAGNAGGDAAAGEKKVVSEYAKWMEGAGSTPGAVDTPQEDLAPEDEEDEHLGPTKPVAGSSTEKAPAVSEAETKVRENKDAATRLQKKLDQMGEDKLAFASLVDKCLAKHDGQYNYKTCFFDDSKQDHVLLGRWSGWISPKEAKFNHGHMCPGGPERELKVVFECGSTEEVVDVSEPSRCAYEAHVTHPGACTETDLALLEKPPVKHPKDEL